MAEETFNANGQKVFVEPTWITGETCLFTLKQQMGFVEFHQFQKRLQQTRMNFLQKLQEEGYVITTDKYDTDNVVSLIMNDIAVCEENVDYKTYKKEFDRRIFEAGGENLHYPHTLSFEEYLSNPFFPAVLKNEHMNAGIDKFLIETEEQVNILKTFYNENKNNPKYKETIEGCIFQQYLISPPGIKSYMRVLADVNGNVLGASLKYTRETPTKKNKVGDLEKIFLDEKSKYFLNCKTMFNYYSNGESISMHQPKYSGAKKSILRMHNLDENAPLIPQEILDSIKDIMSKCNRELGIICGFDFMYNYEDKKWYYLENQAFPAIDEWLVKKEMKPIQMNSNENILKYFVYEMLARYESLRNYTLLKQMEQKPDSFSL